MIPFILAAVGGYLIGDSMKNQSFADGGVMQEGIDGFIKGCLKPVFYNQLEKAQDSDYPNKLLKINNKFVVKVEIQLKYKSDGTTIDEGFTSPVKPSNFNYDLYIKYVYNEDIDAPPKTADFYFIINDDWKISEVYPSKYYDVELQYKDESPTKYSSEDFAKTFIGKDEIKKRKTDQNIFRYAKGFSKGGMMDLRDVYDDLRYRVRGIRINEETKNYIYCDVRDWGNWEHDYDDYERDEEDFEDDDSMILSRDSAKRMNEIIKEISSRYPDIDINWDTSEKNYIDFQIKNQNK